MYSGSLLADAIVIVNLRMIRSVIVDDFVEAVNSLKADLTQWCPEVSLIGTANSVKEGIQLIQQTKPQLVFLDIQLGDGEGFDILNELQDPDIQVIFTTGIDNQGIRAIKYSALDYLLKPVDPDELIEAVKKARGKELQQSLSDNLKLLRDYLSSGSPAPKRLALNSADRVHVIQTNEIVRCESERNYTTFFLSTGKQIVVTRTLKEYEELLEPIGFVRVHHSHLINIEFLKEFIKQDGGYVLMKDGSNVPVSVRKKEDLLRILGL
jgi:two-component system LytT family response regulator